MRSSTAETRSNISLACAGGLSVPWHTTDMSLGGGATNMEEVFQSFCVFGGGLKDSGALMDGAKFGKFCRDMKILDKKLTSTEADIFFAQVKG